MNRQKVCKQIGVRKRSLISYYKIKYILGFSCWTGTAFSFIPQFDRKLKADFHDH